MFRLAIFRPFIGEVIEGSISSCSEQGIKVSTGFFDDIVIPPENMFPDTSFDHEIASFVWHSDMGDAFFEANDRIRFCVTKEQLISRKGWESSDSKEVSYTILGAVDRPGLGNPDWWD